MQPHNWVYFFVLLHSCVCVHPFFRHVVLPKQLSKLVPSSHLMTEDEWRGLGVQQSQGWIHYMIHKPGTVRCNCVNATEIKTTPT